MDKFFSVIVPVYNVEKWLGRCVDSILSQTYDNFELILINDGSTDKSGSICDDYAQKDQRIKVIHKENGGVSAARNIGIESAIGDYIVFVDSDDAISDNYLASAIAGMKNGADWFICSAKEFVFDNGRIVAENDFLLNLQHETTVCDVYSEVDINVAPAFVHGPLSKVYKTQIIKDNAIRFDPDLSLGEDIYFNLAYAKNIKNVVSVDPSGCYFYYRENQESLTKRFYETKYEDSVKIYDEWRRTIIALGVDKDTLDRFEKLYLRVMFSNIVHVYVHTKNKAKRKEMIRKVINNEWVRKSKTCGDESFVVKLTTFFIIKKMPVFVRLLFGMRFGFSKKDC